MVGLRHVLFVAVCLLTSAAGFSSDDIKVESIDPKKIGLESIDLKGGAAPNFNINQIKNIMVKIHFRYKYLDKKDVLELASELEEKLSYEEVTYQNLQTREEKWVNMMVNDAAERQTIKKVAVEMEEVLAVEVEGLRSYGKFATKTEKERYRQECKEWKKNNPNKKFDL